MCRCVNVISLDSLRLRLRLRHMCVCVCVCVLVLRTVHRQHVDRCSEHATRQKVVDFLNLASGSKHEEEMCERFWKQDVLQGLVQVSVCVCLVCVLCCVWFLTGYNLYIHVCVCASVLCVAIR